MGTKDFAVAIGYISNFYILMPYLWCESTFFQTDSSACLRVEARKSGKYHHIRYIETKAGKQTDKIIKIPAKLKLTSQWDVNIWQDKRGNFQKDPNFVKDWQMNDILESYMELRPKNT